MATAGSDTGYIFVKSSCGVSETGYTIWFLCCCTSSVVLNILGVPSPFFLGILLFRKPSKTQGNSRFLKRAMVENNRKGMNRKNNNRKRNPTEGSLVSTEGRFCVFAQFGSFLKQKAEVLLDQRFYLKNSSPKGPADLSNELILAVWPAGRFRRDQNRSEPKKLVHLLKRPWLSKPFWDPILVGR